MCLPQAWPSLHQLMVETLRQGSPASSIPWPPFVPFQDVDCRGKGVETVVGEGIFGNWAGGLPLMPSFRGGG